MTRNTRAVTSREYKMMLQAEAFKGGNEKVAKAAEKFRDDFAGAIADFVLMSDGEVLVGGKFKPQKKKKQAPVRFFDTKRLLLRRLDFVFRRRRPLSGGKAELTLKRRHPDRFLTSGSETGGSPKFEEDIKATKKQVFISLHSLSGKVKGVDPSVEFNKLQDIQSFYEPLTEELGGAYDANKKLHQVGDFTAEQTVLEGPEFNISDDTIAKCALIVWYRKGGSAKRPVVAEFSFRYDDESLGIGQEPFTSEIGRRCFQILQALRDENAHLANWVDLKGPTKTKYVYDLER
jgi:hypothetical protein